MNNDRYKNENIIYAKYDVAPHPNHVQIMPNGLCIRPQWKSLIGLNDWNDWNDWNDLNLYQLDLDNAKLNVQQHWDFSNYSTKTQHLRWMTQNDRREERSLSIFPKLFPINDHDYSVAIIQNWSKTYSDDGGFEDVADFVQLKVRGRISRFLQI